MSRFCVSHFYTTGFTHFYGYAINKIILKWLDIQVQNQELPADSVKLSLVLIKYYQRKIMAPVNMVIPEEERLLNTA